MKYVDVIVPLAVDGVYTYAVPESLEGGIREGGLVLVSFAGNKKYTALVCRLHEVRPEGYEVKLLDDMVEEQVCISPLHLKFLLWMTTYYMATPGEVVKAALPVMFRLESFTMIARGEGEIDCSMLTSQEKMLLEFLRPGEYVALKDVEKCLKIRNSLKVVRSLLEKHYIGIKEVVDELFREKKEQVVGWAREFSEEELVTLLDGLKRAPGQYKMLCSWIERGGGEINRSVWFSEVGMSAAVLKGLCDRKILCIKERTISRLEERQDEVVASHALTPEQLTALQRTYDFFVEKDCVLLRGVTSSGKTEVYIHLIEDYLARGKQVLYMLPEIALTIQIVKRLRRVFGDRVGIYHSGMSDSERAELWRRQCGKEPFGLILGVRSAVFLPFSQLGLIIVDEEHDASYKQKEPAPRYHGRDAAIMLGKMHGAHVLLGSATPSFESYQHAIAGKYGWVELASRYGGMKMPEVVLADLGEFRRKKRMQGSFTPLLVSEMERVLAAGKQVILFQNRRGYSSYVQCDGCGHIPKCRHCDVSMTYYKQRNVLICRYCGAMVQLQSVCDACGTGHYKERTPGTERIEEEVKGLFPDSRIARMDLDVMGSKSRFRQVIEGFEQGETDILIGTQMVTKGLDFGNVKLVGVMDADSMVGFPDFRAEERAFCMLMQVSGRSGRKDEQGKVVIQTADIQNRVYSFVKESDYASFFSLLAPERRLFGYPPFGRMIQVEMRHKDIALLRKFGNLLAGGLREKLGKRVCGPAVPEIGRIGGLYRLILLLKIEPGASISGIKEILKSEIVLLQRQKGGNGVRFFCDVDC